MKIIWVMSYMRSRHANCWATHEFKSETKSGHLHFIDWIDFKEEFRKDFIPLDSKVAAINTLETSTYFQGKHSVNDYLDMLMMLTIHCARNNTHAMTEVRLQRV